MHEYLNFLSHIRHNGNAKSDRTGTGTISVFGHMMRFDLRQFFPILNTKFVPFKTMSNELFWFLEGSTNNERLKEINNLKDDDGKHRPTIWEEWAGPNGELGPIYGSQWRTAPGSIRHVKLDQPGAITANKPFRVIGQSDEQGVYIQDTVDQISEVYDLLKRDPDSRRMVVSAWTVSDLHKMKIPPCHALFQFYTNEMAQPERVRYAESVMGFVVPNWLDEKDQADWLNENNVPVRELSCELTQRSADAFLGVPFNIASYALLTHLFAHSLGMAAREFIWVGGDCHIYSNHLEQVDLQLSRTPDPAHRPQLKITCEPKHILAYTPNDIQLLNYMHQGKIAGPVAV